MIAAAVFAVAALLLGAASLYRGGAWARALAYTALVAGLAGLWWSSLGVPRPLWMGGDVGTVVAYRLDEPRAIYVWVVPEGSSVPLALELPWGERQASELHAAAGQAARNGGVVKMGKAGAARDGNPRGDRMFYSRPAPALPPKMSR